MKVLDFLANWVLCGLGFIFMSVMLWSATHNGLKWAAPGLPELLFALVVSCTVIGIGAYNLIMREK